MKKSLLVVSLLAVITLAACGKKDESASSAPATDTPASLSPTAALQAPTSTATDLSDTGSAHTAAQSAS
ncbi:hypothetical protein [Candidatus Vallotia tarda]|uniref:Uncharacterized protein n=1 Tax=Candidatus Vallotiella hemipterorum TaxID=1177213 RepID=A0A916JTV3_9BURK|nr:hypothetical protein [Candidatus Vallotia tarda]CAG7601752.1 hypothetical protein MYVALT_F_02560 [Candidatus Vallotia tarda]